MPSSDADNGSSKSHHPDPVEVKRRGSGVYVGTHEIDHFTLSHHRGITARITNYGATLTALEVPDRNGRMDDVVLGFESPEQYRQNDPYFGTTIGRYANRIAHGTFSIDGTTYQLACNDGPHHLHGGPNGFHNQLWEASAHTTEKAAVLEMTYTSSHGEEHYPGTVPVTVTYTLGASELRIDFTAETDKKTIVNLTNHAYFNLSGHDAGKIRDHRIRINANRYTPIDQTLIPTGEIEPVKNTPLDFRTSTPIGERLDTSHPQIDCGNGIDHNFVLSPEADETIRKAAEVCDPSSGRVLSVHTTKPGLQFYTGNLLDGTITGKHDTAYGRHGGFCLEPQFFPDAPNHPQFPSPLLERGATYYHTIIYEFDTNPENESEFHNSESDQETAENPFNVSADAFVLSARRKAQAM